MSKHDEYHFLKRYVNKQPISFKTLQSNDLEAWETDHDQLIQEADDICRWGSSTLIPKLYSKWKRDPKGTTRHLTGGYDSEVKSIMTDTTTSTSDKLEKLRYMHTKER